MRSWLGWSTRRSGVSRFQKSLRRPIEVGVRRDAAGATIEVHNWGRAIPPALQPLLFEPFRRGTDERRSGGIGLGLYICHAIAVAHGGRITVTSTEDEGTRFAVTLPFEGSRPTQEGDEAHPGSGGASIVHH